MADINFVTTGPGKSGAVVNWSVTEEATPTAIGDSSGGTGDVSVTVDSGEDIEFLSDNDYTLTHPTLGNQSGKIISVNSSGVQRTTDITSSLSLSTVLTKLAPSRSIPMLEWGSPKTIIESAVRAIIGWDVTMPAGGVGITFPIFGGSRGFNEQGIQSGSLSNIFPVDQTSLAQYGQPVYTPQSDGSVIIAGTYSSNNDTPGVSLPITLTTMSSLVMRVFVNSATSFGQKIAVGDGRFAPSYSNIFLWIIDGSADTLTVNDGSGGAGSTVSLATLDHSRPITFRVSLNPGGPQIVYATDWTGLMVSAQIANTFASSNGNRLSLYGWGSKTMFGTSNIRVYSVQLGDAIWASNYYMQSQGFATNYTATNTGTLAVPPYSGSVFEYIKMACSALNVQLSTVGGTYTISDIGSATYPLDNIIGGTAVLKVDNGSLAKNITVSTTNAYSGFGKVLSVKDGDNLLPSVNLGEVVTKSVKTNNYPVSIFQPLGPANTNPLTPNGGTIIDYYYIEDTHGTFVPGYLWTAGGGSLVVSINSDDSSLLDFIITGPNSFVPGYDAPYQVKKIVYQTGQPAYGVGLGVDVYGQAVFTNPTDIKIQTGASSLSVVSDNAGDVNNIFVDTVSKAYDRASWRITQVNGNNVTLNFTLPIDSGYPFGTWSGLKVSFKDSVYRVVSAHINGATIQVTAVRHITWADFAASNLFPSYVEFTNFWAGKTFGDFKIKPLRNTYIGNYIYPSANLYPSATFFPGIQP